MSLKRISALFPLRRRGARGAARRPRRRAGHASVVIRHQTRGCHAWSVNGGAFKARQSLTLQRGGTLVVTDNDVMPHKLVLRAARRSGSRTRRSPHGRVD